MKCFCFDSLPSRLTIRSYNRRFRSEAIRHSSNNCNSSSDNSPAIDFAIQEASKNGSSINPLLFLSIRSISIHLPRNSTLVQYQDLIPSYPKLLRPIHLFTITTRKMEFMGNEKFTFLKEKTNSTRNQLFIQKENKNQIIIFSQNFAQFLVRYFL